MNPLSSIWLPNRSRGSRRSSLFLLILLLFFLCGSATASFAKQNAEPAPAPAKKAPAQQTGTPKAKAATKKAEAAKNTPQTAAKPKQPAGPPPKALMLRSAGRDAQAPQPEAGFFLNVPDSIGDGEAFPITFRAEGAQTLKIEWRGKTLNLGPCYGNQNICTALLPVPLDEKAKTLPLAMTVGWINGKKEKFTAELPVKLRKYPVQKLKVASKFVSPPKEMQEKIKRDRAEFNAAVSKVTPTRYWNLPFLRPVPGEVTSLFGLRRVFNGVPKNPHKGVDFNGKTGDPVASMDDGVVVLVSEHYYSGNIVMVDHGLGVVSSYIHLSAFNVVKGQKVKRGDIIGFIGSTGRVTGPHLHLSLHVLGVGVNAAACINM